jgi:hypothetical protein
MNNLVPKLNTFLLALIATTLIYLAYVNTKPTYTGLIEGGLFIVNDKTGEMQIWDEDKAKFIPLNQSPEFTK